MDHVIKIVVAKLQKGKNAKMQKEMCGEMFGKIEKLSDQNK